ncbi:MAG: hypothetical protein ABJA98_13770 [Acidobacteriota bacterium]
MLSAGLAASQLFGGGKTTYRAFKDPAGRFELEYPTKDWKSLSLPGGTSSVAGFSHKDGPTLFIEHLRLDERMTPDEIAAIPDVELNRLKELQPKARDFKSDLVESKAGRGVLIRYARLGTEPESVMQYSILIGQQDLYRLNAIVSDKLLPKYESIVRYMIQSFIAKPGA